MPLENWVAYDVGSSKSFSAEVKKTVSNKKLMRHLSKRRSTGKRTSIEDVRKRLGLK